MNKGPGACHWDGFCFLLFLAANTLLSYFPLPLEGRIGLVLVGLVLPFTLLLVYASAPRKNQEPDFKKEFLPRVPPWVWMALGAMAIGFRFYRLTSFALWPTYDEGMLGYYVLGLLGHWDWKLFFGNNQTPPLYPWGLGLVFKLLGPSLFSLWFFPALVSLLAVPMGYLAARQFFSKSFSFVLAALQATGFWPLFIGRFSHMTVLVLLGECGVLFLMGLYLNRSPQNEKNYAVLLGFGVGLGFYIYISWPVVAAMVGLVILFPLFQKGRGRAFLLFGLFSGACLLVISPLIWQALHQGYGQDLHNLSAFGQSVPFSEQWRVSLSYITCLFWGMNLKFFTYQPVWGGYLNPLLDSFFFLGLLEIFQNRRERLIQWLALAALLFLLPGILTRERETFRVVAILPIVLTVTVFGFTRLLEKSSPGKTVFLATGLLFASTGLDFIHLEKFHQIWDSKWVWKGYAKSQERYRAFFLLEKTASHQGPGLVFSNFTPGLCDQTLSVADYAFNAVENPAFSINQAHWAAVITNVNYKPFLEKRFGPAEAYALSSDQPPSDGGWMLWVVPLTPANRTDFLQWIQADQSLKNYIGESLGHLQGESYEKVWASLRMALPYFEKDRFLTSCYWEQAADIYLKQTFKAAGTPPETDGGPEIKFLIKATTGYPAAHIYNHLGNFWLLLHNSREARKAFGQSLKAPLNLTDSAQYLKR